MRKKLLLGVCAAVLVCAAVVAWGNSRRSMLYLEDTGMQQEAILRELPEIALTEAEVSIRKALLALPEVQALGTEHEGATLSPALARKAAGAYLPEDADISGFWAFDGQVCLEYSQGEERRTGLEFSRDGSVPTTKSIAVYGRDWDGGVVLKALYEDQDGGAITKSIQKRDWLYFLRVWEH